MKTSRTIITSNKSFFLKTAVFAAPLMIMATLLTVTPNPAHADNGDVTEQRLENRLLRMSEQLELSVAQQEELRGLMEEGLARRQEIMSKYNVDKEEMRAIFRETHELRSSFEDRLSEVLTAKQMEEFRANRKENRQHSRE